ncbi:glycosyltransferase [Soonwooa sp.]|uniref:glycosyltransferase n=1 Tax=Soonwooa sp. TaxID=1938592 RepID=UPI0028AFF03A|nr:glycosyltransferase [Soonwooa sp.]
MEQKKSILLVYYKLFKPGGVAKVLTNLANALSEQGYTVEILLLINEREHFYPLDPNIKVHNIDTFSHWAWKICEFSVKHLRFIPKITNINAYIYHIGVFLMLRNWMRKNHQNYDTIISAWYKLSSFLSLNKKANHKTIAWEHVTYQTGGILFNDILRRYYKNLKGIVCINSPAIEYYKQFNRTYFIPNIIGEPFENQPKINFENKENLISFVGRLDKEKNVITLLEIFKKANISKDWKFQIIGDGNERVNLEQFVEKNQLQDRVIFYGTKTSDEILELLRKSKIFGFTSLKEALPTVLVEAMFCSNTIISYNCNYGPSDIVKNNSGFLIDINNKEDFIQKLEMLTNSDEKLEKMMESASKEAQNWKQNEILKKWQEII